MLYLIRHAAAVEDENDDIRRLSTEGREQVRRLAAFLRACGELQPEEVWHSPLVRARETAALLAEGLKWRVPLKEVADLKPEDDPSRVAARLRPPHSLALVGHEPYLSALASLLVVGRAAPAAFVMRKCAVLALERIRGGDTACWAVCWQIAPELLA